ncbi:hypothetical protein BQ8482_440012 [Mesorhizobium delmotii]|uniref:Uncharacterized protein n=1 Tax=Mesorhizobium delmotii TaxID=1631247 RepID=A0A2P9ATG6_9HYPH|nr:hypothetical protein BQ8482_440012 [Mesorhizobium delmotii]
MVFHRRFAFALQSLRRITDGIVVLGVDAHQRAIVSRHLHQPDDVGVADSEHFIGGKDFDGPVAFRDQRRQLAQKLIGGPRHDHVEAVVDPRRGGPPTIVVDHRPHRPPWLLDGEAHHAGCAASDSRSRFGLECARNRGTTLGRLLDVAMRVDTARHDKASGGIHHAFGVPKVLSKRDDPAVTNTDVIFPDIGGCDHGSAANDKIEPVLHVFSSYRSCWQSM